jgi:hypothetical protein
VCASRALRSVVVVLAKAECVKDAMDALKGESLNTHAISLHATPVGTSPGDPVFVVWGERDAAERDSADRDRGVRDAPSRKVAVTTMQLPEPDLEDAEPTRRKR